MRPGAFDPDEVRSLLVAQARAGEPISYSGALLKLGLRFTRPRMRALCRVLAAIDEAGRARGEPELAVLVVRESDGLPGQGWWVGSGEAAWTGPEARAHVERLQRAAFGYWQAVDGGGFSPAR